MTAAELDNPRLRLGPLAGKIMTIAGLIGLAGLLLSVLLAFSAGWEHFFRAYLTAFMFVISIALGGLFFTFVQHATRAGWSVVIRRIAEAFAGNLLWLWILFLPILALVVVGRGGLLYDWMDSAHAAGDELYAHKRPYLNETFWVIRAVVYLAVWAGAGWFFLRNSVAQDDSGDVNLTHRMQRWAPLAAILYAVTQTFAVIDWVMALEAHWFSTMFGVYFFAASCCGFFSVQILVAYFLQRNGKVQEEITLEHYQDMGKQLFAFGIVFWAYIAYSQYMLIWYGNIPEETGWYMARQLGGWGGVSILLLVAHFFIPFLLLVTKHTKRIRGLLALIALAMLLLHFVDVYWLVMPHVPAEAIAASTTYGQVARQVAAGGGELVGYHPHLMDLTCLIGLVGLLAAGTAHRLRRCALIPLGDPRLGESLAFENM